MKQDWAFGAIEQLCEIEYGTRVVRKRDAGSKYPTYGGGGATFFMDEYNRQDRMVIARFAMSEQCTRFVKGNFFLNDSGLTICPKGNNTLDDNFLNYQILALNDDIYSLGRGTAQKNLNMDEFKRLNFTYPKTLDEQKRIVAKLDECFEAINKARANVEKNLHNSKELFQSQLNQIFSQKGDGWVEKKLGETTYVKSGGTPLRSNKEFWDNGQIPWYSSGELNNLYTEEPKRFITQKGIENSNAKLFPKGSLLIGMYDTAALKMSIIDRDAAFNQAIAGVRPTEGLNLQFLLHSISAIKHNLLQQRRGVRQKNLSLRKIMNISIPTPSFNIQERVVKELNTFRIKTQALESKYQQKLDALDELKKSILQKAFNGEL